MTGRRKLGDGESLMVWEAIEEEGHGIDGVTVDREGVSP